MCLGSPMREQRIVRERRQVRRRTRKINPARTRKNLRPRLQRRARTRTCCRGYSEQQSASWVSVGSHHTANWGTSERTRGLYRRTRRYLSFHFSRVEVLRGEYVQSEGFMWLGTSWLVSNPGSCGVIAPRGVDS